MNYLKYSVLGKNNTNTSLLCLDLRKIKLSALNFS
jgi:hypothetical protein